MAKKTITKRGNNEGSIYQRKDGLWVAAISIGVDDDGRPKRKVIYGKTRAEVAVKMTTTISEKLKSGHSSIKNDNFQTLMQEWLLTFKKASVSARTFEKSLSNARLHIYPYIGEMKIEEVTTPIIQRLLNNLKMKEYALDTVKKIKFQLRQFFEYAVDSNFIDRNPVDKVKLQSHERKTVTEDEYKAVPIEKRKEFLQILDKSPILKPICMMSMFAGMRIGEVLALKWKNIDLINKVVSIENAVTLIPKLDRIGKVISRETVVSDTKTAASVREVPLPPILVKALEEWKHLRWIREQETGLSFLKPTDFVFSNNDGELRTYTGTRAMFDKLMRASDLKEYKIHFHSLRHTYSSMLFEEGENPKVIQMLLGHKDVTTTIRTYNSVDRSYFREATDKLDRKFS